MRRLIIVGACGHGKVVADIAKKNGYSDIAFLDDNEELTECGGYPVIGKPSTYLSSKGDLFVAIGNADIRRRIMDTLGICVTLIHPDAVISDDVVIGEGSVVMAGVVINPGAKIGRGCILNTCCSVDHDCNVRDFVHVSVGTHICGTVDIGEHTWIGAGSTISNNVSIVGNCMVGAGTVVVKDINDAGVYVGIPARKMKR